MTDLTDVPWPPEPSLTDRLTLRSTRASDRARYIDLLCSEAVNRYLGGAHSRAELEASAPAVPGDRPGVFGVELAGYLIGMVSLARRDASRPGHVGAAGDELEVGYQLLPDCWGGGYAAEAVSGVLAWAGTHVPAEPIVLVTQIANEASVRLAVRLGFREVERFVEFGAEQWFGVREPQPSGRG